MELGFVALGLVQGALAGLNATGFVLLWRTTRVVNLAQPAIGLVGGVLAGMLVSSAGWSFWWAAPLGIGLSAALAFGAERLVLARLADLPRAVPMVATIGLAQLFGALQSGIPFAFGGRLPSYDVAIGMEWFVFPVLLKGGHLLALVTFPLAVLAVHHFVHRSRVGVAALAVGQDQARAQALGVDSGFVRSMAWTVAGALSGVAGVLSIPVLGFSLGDGVAPTVLLLALAPAVVGGLRSLGVTFAAALGVGVAYQFALLHTPAAGMADAVLGLVILVCFAARRSRSEREAAVERASSWSAGTTPPPAARAVRRDVRWRAAVRLGAVVLAAAAALPPLWLSPSADVRYGTGAALALAAVATAVAWTFSGEVLLGLWGVAALGATALVVAPGPLAIRAAVGLVIGIGTGIGLGIVGQRRAGMATAVAGLAVAVAAPYLLLRLGSPSLGFDGELSASAAGAVASVAVIGVAVVRSHRLGLRMIAARDQPRHARGIGVEVVRHRHVALGAAGGLAAVAGMLYLACVPSGLAPGAFDATRSLDVVALAVVGGLGSALGAALGAAALVVGGAVLPPPWGSVASGAGVLWVVLFAPAGVSGALTVLRDRLAAVLVPDAHRTVPPSATGVPVASFPDTTTKARVAGADTREALQHPLVRRAMVAAFAIAGPSMAGVLGAPLLVRDHLGVETGASGPWLVLVLAALTAVAAIAGWRRAVVASEVPVVAIALAALGVFVLTEDDAMVAALALVGAAPTGWTVARVARRAADHTPAHLTSAASGLVAAAGCGGLVAAAHLAAVAAGNDLLHVARWAVVYLAIGTIALTLAGRGVPTAIVSEPSSAAGGRRRWTAVRVEGLAVDLGGHRILSDVTLEVRPGELVALVGANGSGKSTLLRAIAGVVGHHGGRVDVAGEDLAGLRPHERAAAGVAFVDGARPVFPDLSVRQNLRVGAFLTHRTEASFASALEEIVAIIPQLAHRLDATAGLLSGGEQRLLAVAQTLLRRPVVLLADELGLGLDVRAQQLLFRLLRDLANDGIAVIAVDHDVEALARLVDRTIAIQDGGILEVEPAATDVRDLVPAAFLGSATR